MELFQKCYNFTRADEAKEANIYPYFHPIDENEGPVVSIYGKQMVMAGSNNYLGLTAHPLVKQAAKDAIDKYGTGCSGSRYLTGTVALHNELEEKLAKFLQVEAVLMFSTGYQTSLGVISSLVNRGDYIIMDKENHASLMNGAITAKGMAAEFKRFKHSDMDDLERVLATIPLDAGKLIVTDGVFSVTGEICNLPKINELAKKYNARVMCDDAHAAGVIGKGGRGTVSYFDTETDLIMGTFSKSFASLGGYVAGKERVINYIKHTSGALIFSASPTPASIAATLKALELLEQDPDMPNRLVANSNYMRDNFKQLGFNIYESKTAIVPVILGDSDRAFKMWRMLFDRGIFVNAFIPPGVPENMSMMRTSYMLTHQREHLDKILDAFQSIGKELGLI
ncbi:MAG: aminotransferase class I/II-fold pyridoxal phosphate-dependent enzyme [Ignavibacteria bacterium]|jgi:8-amino-7-oxononanoate synthase|nr:aminotransferase class I/II-fold pyridoxal phosphate-dependent enzyme [Ignavibacteria bacterium]